MAEPMIEGRLSWSGPGGVKVALLADVFLPPAVLEILQLVKKRDLFLADSHILELEQECTESDRSPAPPEDAVSPGIKDGGRRKAKDVELLYEELQKELWSVVRESLRSPTAGPNLGLVVQVSLDVQRCKGFCGLIVSQRLSPELVRGPVCRFCSKRSRLIETGLWTSLGFLVAPGLGG
ncbi:unnamed protein product [Tetraodon nigroviridis]|uniref:(spotted green pufferfish) hypothetical protein n=1 Tax=Tetraodon nigroviridis TaxID=99883 RepID=Q4SB12_TETNG|nr:unnamed protein product [Tetraodon nigroviridis]